MDLVPSLGLRFSENLTLAEEQLLQQNAHLLHGLMATLQAQFNNGMELEFLQM